MCIKKFFDVYKNVLVKFTSSDLKWPRALYIYLLTLCFEKWRQKKRNQQTGKNPFNFAVDGLRQTHPYPYAQRPITNDDEFRADVVDTKKIVISDENKKNIPPKSPNVAMKDPNSSPNLSQSFVHAPTMASIKQFDNRFKLPMVKKQKLDEKN